MRQAASFHERGSRKEGREDLREALLEVTQIADKLSFSHDVRRRANTLISEVKAGGFGHGVAPPVLSAATLYIACRERKMPVTLRELALASGSDPREVGRCYLGILENLHISRPGLNGKGYVYHLALKRSVSEQVLKLSQSIINRMSARGLGGRNPMTLAAAALYVACCNLGENVTQAEVAEAAGIGEESVRECCKEIRTLVSPYPP
jgi:transcription initiation factor TFIIB